MLTGRNRIAHLPESMRVCEQLEHLDLSSNRLTRFPGFIVDMPRLTHLDLSSNAIAYLPQDVHTLGKVREQSSAHSQELLRADLLLGWG